MSKKRKAPDGYILVNGKNEPQWCEDFLPIWGQEEDAQDQMPHRNSPAGKRMRNREGFKVVPCKVVLLNQEETQE